MSQTSMANIRHKMFALITICLAVVVLVVASIGSFVSADASLRLYEDYTPDDAKKDFDDLNKWLLKTSGYVEDPVVNLNLAKNKLTSMQNGPAWVKLYDRSLVKPIEMLEQLSKVSTCDDETLELIRYIHLATKRGQGGYKRASKVATYFAQKAANKCDSYINGRFIDISSNILNSDRIGRLADVIYPRSYPAWNKKENSSRVLKDFDTDLARAYTKYEFTDEDLFGAMEKLAVGDPKNNYVLVRPNEKTGNLDKFALKNNAHYIYDTYLAPPCKYYNEVFRQFVESFYAIQDYSDFSRRGHKMEFISRRPDYVKLGVFRYLVCDRVLKRRHTLSEFDKIIEKRRSCAEDKCELRKW